MSLLSELFLRPKTFQIVYLSTLAAVFLLSFCFVVYKPTLIDIMSLLLFLFVVVLVTPLLLFIQGLFQSLFRIIQLNLRSTCNHHKFKRHMFFPFSVCLLKPYSTSISVQDVVVFVLVKIVTGCSILSWRVLLTAVKNENVLLSCKVARIFKQRNWDT